MSVMSSVKLSAQIRSIKGSSKNLREQIQEALISCAYYAAKDGNTNPFNQLLEAVGNGVRREAFIAWSKEHGYVTYDKDTKKLACNASKRKANGCHSAMDFTDTEVAIRLATPWYDMRIETTDGEEGKKAFDVYAYLETALKKLDKEGQTELADMLQESINGFTKAHAFKGLAAAEIKRVSQAKLVEELGEALL